MRWLLPLLLASLVTLAFALSTSAGAGQVREAAPLPRPQAPRVHCKAPRALELRRFEDGSAQLRCAGRVIARVSVPG
jgi:hypothetical protein